MPVSARVIAQILLWLAACVTTAMASAQTQEAAPASAGAVAAPADTPGDARQGTFKTIQGEVRRVHGGTASPAAVGDPLWEGDRIETGPRSAAAIMVRDGSVLSVGPESRFELTRFDFEPTTQNGNLLLTFARGTMRVVTGLIAKLHPERVRVTTPTTVIGVRGTDFIVEETP